MAVGERWRAQELAERAGITTALLRSYQSKGLVAPPERQGRLAWYGPAHEERLAEIRRLKARGYTLKAIADLLATTDGNAPGGAVGASSGGDGSATVAGGGAGGVGVGASVDAGAPGRPVGAAAAGTAIHGAGVGAPAGAGDAGTAAGPRAEPSGRAEPPLTLRQVAREANVPAELVRSMERSRLLRPFQVDGEWVYHPADVAFVRRVLSLLAGGLALDDFLALAEPLLDMVDELGLRVAAEWRTVVLERLRAGHLPKRRQADVLAWSLREMAETVGQLVAYNLERAVIIDVQAQLDAEGSPSERKALARALRGQARHATDPPTSP